MRSLFAWSPTKSVRPGSRELQFAKFYARHFTQTFAVPCLESSNCSNFKNFRPQPPLEFAVSMLYCIEEDTGYLTTRVLHFDRSKIAYQSHQMRILICFILWCNIPMVQDRSRRITRWITRFPDIIKLAFLFMWGYLRHLITISRARYLNIEKCQSLQNVDQCTE